MVSNLITSRLHVLMWLALAGIASWCSGVWALDTSQATQQAAPQDSRPAPPTNALDAQADVSTSRIRNGCIRSVWIKKVHFIDNQTGIFDLTGGSKVLVSLRNRCSGIRNEGYVHKPTNGQFCQGDILRVINYGTVCMVENIEPYTEPAEGDDSPAAPADGEQ